jgi:transaldolase
VSEMAPVCTIMVGRTDDWLKVVANKQGTIVDPRRWSGPAWRSSSTPTASTASAATAPGCWRRRTATTTTGRQFIGGDVVLTIPFAWAQRFNGSDVAVVDRIDDPVDPRIVAELRAKFEDFRKAYDADGMTVAEFDGYGATRRTLRQFIGGYAELCQMIRDAMVPNPDK